VQWFRKRAAFGAAVYRILLTIKEEKLMTESVVAIPSAGRAESPAAWRAEASEVSSSGLSWPAILAGAFAAAAAWFTLLALGAGMGLSSVSPWPVSGASARQVGPGAILWLMVVQLLACSLGGYLAGRLRSRWATLHAHEVHFRDTAHGFLAWAVGLVISVAFLSSLGVSIAKDAPAVAAEGANDYYVDSLFRADHPIANADDQMVRKEVGVILANALRRTEIVPQDRSYLSDLVATRTGLDSDHAEARVNETLTAARQAMDTGRKAVAHSLYWLVASLLLGAFGASLAATRGGRQRDNVIIIGLKPAGRI
jgi:hypothetical protein